MFNSSSDRPRFSCLVAAAALVGTASIAVANRGPADRQASGPPTRQQVIDAMKRATTFMVENVSTRGGYVWNYLPDLSRRWGELEARDTMIWVQPPGTPTMGHLFLDAYHATRDEYYYRAAEKAAAALIAGQLPSGGWNYVIDTAGDQSLQQWYDTIGRNAWRLEEFQHNWGNGTFDDGGTAQATTLLLRLYLEKHDAKVKAALDRAIDFVIDSQYPVGAWPQRFPLKNEFSHHGKPDYTSFVTFNDEVTAANIDLLILCYQALGDKRLLAPIRRGMDSYLAVQQPAPQAGWALQYTVDMKPAGARTYEPAGLATHTTAASIEQLLKFFRLTGDSKYLARIPEALDWLDSVRLPPDVAAVAGEGRTHPTFVEVGTNRPLYVHRHGSNVVNGAYTVDGNPSNTIGHYSSFRFVDVAGLRRQYLDARAADPSAAAKGSPLAPGGAPGHPAKYFVVNDRPQGPPGATAGRPEDRVVRILDTMDEWGRWKGELGTTSHPYKGDGPPEVAPGDYSRSLVGDDTDTSPYRAAGVVGVSTSSYIRNMGELIRFLDRK